MPAFVRYRAFCFGGGVQRKCRRSSIPSLTNFHRSSSHSCHISQPHALKQMSSSPPQDRRRFLCAVHGSDPALMWTCLAIITPTIASAIPSLSSVQGSMLTPISIALRKLEKFFYLSPREFFIKSKFLANSLISARENPPPARTNKRSHFSNPSALGDLATAQAVWKSRGA